jgi:hypothetical protein
MVELQLAVFAEYIREFQRLKCVYEEQGIEGRLEEKETNDLIGQINDLIEPCQRLRFTSSLITMQTSRNWLERGYCEAVGLPNELNHILDSLMHDLEQSRYYKLDADLEDYFERANLFGDSVREKFPSAAPDIEEAGNCLATNRYTAAVFHLMRVVEWGLRALAVHLGIKKLRSRKKSGKVKLTPVSHSDWEHILDALNDAVNKKIEKLKRGSEKQGAQEFYYPALQDIRAVRDAWRNHVMHTRAVYGRDDAKAIFTHVKRIMGVLSARISEV